jgi:hypothetical protein
MTSGNHRTGMILMMFILLSLALAIFCGGCVSSPSGQNSVRVEILEKKMSPADLGECTYRTEMAVTNNGTADIHALSIVIELYDPGEQKVAARESIPIGDLRAGAVKNATSTLQTHCRQNYTLRAYAQY